MKALAILRDLAAIAALSLLGLLLWHADRGLEASTQDLAATQKQLRATLLDVARFTQDATGVTAEVRRTLKASQASSEEAVANSAKALQSTQEAADALENLVRHTDAQVNGELLPRLSSVIASQGTQLDGIENQTARLMDQVAGQAAELDPLLRSAGDAAANLARVSADPSIPATLANLAQASQGMAETSRNAAAASHDLAEAVHRETRPASFTVRLAGYAVDGVTKAASIVAGFVK